MTILLGLVPDPNLGPYAKAILRFQVTFPSEYPYLPPSVTFVTDIFHPLITPLTTYTYTTGYLSSDTVSATDEERLPPGGYSLRHGFPHWFKRTHQSPTSSPVSSQNVSLSHDMSARARKDSNEDQPQEYSSCSSSSVVAVPQNLPGFKQSAHLLALDGQSRPITMLDVLQYIKQSFDEEHFLNMLPLEAAGNPGAWKAWRAYRSSINERANTASSKPDWGQGEEWNWDGVWEERVRKGVETSISESVLYGGTGAGHDFVSLDAPEDIIIVNTT